MSTTIYLVESGGDQHAFRNETDAQEFAKGVVLDAFETTGLSEDDDLGIDITRLSGPGSLPADWLELIAQWNEFWCDDDDQIQVLISEIPLD